MILLFLDQLTTICSRNAVFIELEYFSILTLGPILRLGLPNGLCTEVFLTKFYVSPHILHILLP